MKKTVKIITSLMMIAALLCCLCACGEKEPTLVGRWSVDGASGNVPSFRFEKNGTFTHVNAKGETLEGNYTVNGSKLMMQTAVTVEYTGANEFEGHTLYATEDGTSCYFIDLPDAVWKLEGDKLSITSEGTTTVYNRVK
ncbi:MAG: hypothetical protein CW338_02195 [Clostridiales bacterium]|nr:hypothetical protein [Clostridiales bacterium]